MEIQRLAPIEIERLRTLRLSALQDAPDSFGTTFEEAVKWPIETWVQQLTHLATFVAVLSDADVGLVRGAPSSVTKGGARLISLWVAPEARGKGIARLLIDAVIDWARTEGFTELRMGVSDGNEPAIALYDRLGFERTGEVSRLPPPREHLGKHERVLKL